jgi:hypothetical protein
VSFGKTVVLRSLSPVGRSKHALELEKRSANLLVEEGTTCAQILVCLIFSFDIDSSDIGNFAYQSS